MRRLLVTLGGFPPAPLLIDVVRTLTACLPGCTILVAGGGRLNAASMRMMGAQTTILPPLASLTAAMRSVDLAVTAGGQTLLELLALGVPSLVIGVAANQDVNIRAVRRARAAVLVGSHDQPDVITRLAAAASRCAESTRVRRDLAARGRQLIDGQGALRLARILVDRTRAVSGGASS